MKTFKENRFDELFREKFANFGENPPESVLERIKNTASGLSVPSWKKGGFFAGIGGVVLVVSIILLINFFNTETDNSKQNKHLANNTVISADDNFNNQTEVLQTFGNLKELTKKTGNLNNYNQETIQNNELKSNSNNKVIETNQTTVLPPVNTSTLPDNNLQPNIQSDFTITVNIKTATCRKPNGKASLCSNDNSVKFYWMDIDSQKPVSFIENLYAGTYNIKANSVSGIIKLFTVVIPDSGIVKSKFTHYEMTQLIGVPVYFSNKTTVDGIYNEYDNMLFKWYFGDGVTSNETNPEHLYNSTGPFVISLVAYNSIGCKDSSSSFPLNIADPDINPPNIFSPNGDGINDVFKPAVQELRTFDCIIMNRNGEKLYEWKDPEQGWDGKINHGLQMASPGTYYYFLKGVGIDEKVIIQKGFLQLTR